jgi:hypothetical protein
MKPVVRLTTIMLSIVALAHLLRFLFRIEVIAGGYRVPMWVSVIGFVAPAALAVALWRENRAK